MNFNEVGSQTQVRANLYDIPERQTMRTVIWFPGVSSRDGKREGERGMGEGERDLNCYPINHSNFSTSASSINKMKLKTKLYIPFRVLNNPQGEMGSKLIS